MKCIQSKEKLCDGTIWGSDYMILFYRDEISTCPTLNSHYDRTRNNFSAKNLGSKEMSKIIIPLHVMI